MQENTFNNAELEQIQLFDKIVSSCMINTFSESKDGVVFLKDFYPENVNHKFMFEVAKITTTLYPPRRIVLDMKLFQYLKFKFKNRKIKLEWGRKKKFRTKEYSFDNMLEFVRTSYDVKEDIYEKIYNEYWKDKKYD